MDGEQPRGGQRSEQQRRRYDDIRVQGVLFGFHYVPLVSTRLTGPPKNLERRAENILGRTIFVERGTPVKR